jgi:hypothetical protein
MDEIREANRRSGGHWFSRDTMRFFNSRVSGQVIGGRFFVSSERYDYNAPRLYTIREALEDGSIETVGGFQAWTNARDAKRTAESLAAMGWASA